MEKKEINASVAIQVLPNVVGSDEIVRVVDEVIEFKRYVYERALTELSRHLRGLESMGEVHARQLELRQAARAQDLAAKESP